MSLDMLQPAVIAMLVIIVIGQLLTRQNLENKLAASKKREKPLVMITGTFDRGKGDTKFVIYLIQRQTYWSPAGFTSELNNAQQFPTRGLAATFANNMNCIVEE